MAGQRLIDDNGTIDFIDAVGVQCFIDDVSNFTCGDVPPPLPPPPELPQACM